MPRMLLLIPSQEPPKTWLGYYLQSLFPTQISHFLDFLYLDPSKCVFLLPVCSRSIININFYNYIMFKQNFLFPPGRGGGGPGGSGKKSNLLFKHFLVVQSFAAFDKPWFTFEGNGSSRVSL